MDNNNKNNVYADIWETTNVFGRVERGAKWLDNVKPNWFTLIDVSDLDIASGSQCICGQVFMDEVKNTVADFEDEFGDVHYCEIYDHGFDYVINELFAETGPTSKDSYDIAIEHGFNIVNAIDRVYPGYENKNIPWEPIEYELLASEWLMQIEKRLAEI